MSQNDIASVRRAIRSLATEKHRRRYPVTLRARIVAVVHAHPDMAISSLARALDMAPQTLERMASKARTSLVPVRVTANPATRSALVVRGPSGIVIEGLDLNSVAELIRVLS